MQIIDGNYYYYFITSINDGLWFYAKEIHSLFYIFINYDNACYAYSPNIQCM